MSADKLHDAIPILFTKGTSYKVGYNIGKCFGDRIKAYLDGQGKFLSSMTEFYNSQEGRDHIKEYIEASEREFPNYMAELKGTADGAEIALDKILVCNFWRELYAHPRNSGRPQSVTQLQMDEPIGCTDILLNNDRTKVIGHNEDGELCMNDIDYIICAEIDEFKTKDGRTFPPEKFVAHTYPGLLPGGCFGFNNHGLGYSVNTCWSAEIPRHKVGESFHMRHFLTAKNKDDLVKIMKYETRGSTAGIGVNAGFLSDSNLYSFEVCPHLDKPGNKVAMVTVSNTEDISSRGPFYCRTNHPIELGTEAIFTLPGTVYRYDRVHQITSREKKQDILAMLGDTSHPTHPVYRRGLTPTDQNNGTACTSLLDFKERTLNVYKNNPKDATGPVVRLPMDIFG